MPGFNSKSRSKNRGSAWFRVKALLLRQALDLSFRLFNWPINHSRGALVRGLRLSSSQGAPFWLSDLILQSNGLVYGKPLTLFVSTTENQFISPMLIQTTFNFSSVVQRLVCRFSGLRLLASRWFLVFLASGPCVESASSYFFRSAVPPRWRCTFSQLAPVAKFKLPVFASGSNISVKPTRLRRSAYLAR